MAPKGRPIGPAADARSEKSPNYYLVLYNAAQFIGWSIVLYQLVLHFVNGGDINNVWPAVTPLLVYFQFAAALEVLHSVLGLVSTPVFTVFVQVLSRVALVTICLEYPEAREQWSFPLMVGAWSITEVVRYSFYAAGQFGSPPYFLTWLRYTLFIVLYPSGVTGELVCLYSMLHVARDIAPFPVTVSADIVITLKHFLIFLMCLYPVGLPGLYLHMLAQRRKYIGGGGSQQKTNKKKKKTN